MLVELDDFPAKPGFSLEPPTQAVHRGTLMDVTASRASQHKGNGAVNRE
jgi:hypothetical protein